MKTIQQQTLIEKIKDFFGLKRNVAVLSFATFILGFGEELWSKFVPKYLEALGAAAVVVGLYGTLKDFLDAVYQYPGGRLTDTMGYKNSLVLFTFLAFLGYIIYFLSNSWLLVLLGTFFVMAWSSFSLPALFAVIGESLPRERRSIAFAVQSILKRLPIVLAPPLGGVLIAQFGLVQGVKWALLATIILALLTIALQWLSYKGEKVRETTEFKGAIQLFSGFSPSLRLLLTSDILIRFCEGLPEVFIIFYALDIVRIEPLQFGLLISVQMATAILVYIPVAKLSDRFSRKPFVILTFAFFSLYPLAITLSRDFTGLILAFIVGGLREIGEPARKALIVDFTPEETRGSSVGLYYLIRGLAVSPASFIGGLLWQIFPRIPFVAAFIFGIAGTLLPALFMKSTDRS